MKTVNNAFGTAAAVCGLTLLLAPCAALADTREEALDDSTRGVEFEASGHLRVEVGDSAGIRIEAQDADALAQVEVELVDDTVIIRQEPGSSGWWLFGQRDDREPIEVVVVLEDVESISFDGAGDLVAVGVRGGELDLQLSGAADCSLEELELEVLSLAISGATNCGAQGRAHRQDIAIAGAGDYDGLELDSAVASISITGAGDVRLAVSDELDVSVTGAGAVRYRGAPRVSKSVLGSGSIEQIH